MTDIHTYTHKIRYDAGLVASTTMIKLGVPLIGVQLEFITNQNACLSMSEMEVPATSEASVDDSNDAMDDSSSHSDPKSESEEDGDQRRKRLCTLAFWDTSRILLGTRASSLLLFLLHLVIIDISHSMVHFDLPQKSTFFFSQDCLSTCLFLIFMHLCAHARGILHIRNPSYIANF